jgi:hypothetical protein
VAWRGNIGEYTDEVEDELRLKVGQGILAGQRMVSRNTCPTPTPTTGPRPSRAPRRSTSRCSSRR